MGFFNRLKGAFRLAEAATGPRFSIGPDSIPAEFFGLTSYEDETVPLPRVSRRAAMQVPGVKRGRDLICAPIGSLRIGVLNQQLGDVTNTFLQQPEPDVPRSVTYTRLAEDLLFEGRAWWRITKQDYRGFPMEIRRLNPRSVDIRQDAKVWVRKDGSMQGESWEWVPDELLIRFDAPTDGILVAGAGAIRTVLMLDRRAYRSSSNPVPDGYFTPYGEIDPFEDDDTSLTEEERAQLDTARNWLRAWASQRRESSQGYVPAGLKYEQLSWDPKQLQLAEARQHAVLEIARLMGLEPEDLGVPVTSRTYFNAETKRRDRIDFTLGMYIDAVQDRLSMGDVTPRGQLVRFNVDDFVRTDTLARYQAYATGLQVGAIADKQEVRQLEGKAPLTPQQLAGGTPAAATPEEPVGDNVRQINPAGTRVAGQSFGVTDVLAMSATVDAAFRVDAAKRQITGTVVPYGGAQAYSMGARYQFAKGTIQIPADVTRVKMFVNHDENQAIGHALALTDTDAGLVGTFQLDRSDDASKALEKAEDKVWDGLSAGIRQGGKYTEKDGVRFAVQAPLGEVSLCPSPAFDDARVSAVALSADSGRNTMKCTKCGQVHAAGVTECNPQHLAAFTAATQQFNQSIAAAGATQSPPAGTVQTVALAENPQFGAEIAKGISDGFAALVASGALSVGGAGQSGQASNVGQGERQFVAAGGQGAAQFTVTEELPYRFDGLAGKHSFSEDMRDMANGDPVAKQRVDEFLNEAFAVTTGNVTALNPTKNRPELYVPQLEFQRPLFDSVSTGPIADKTPFTVPKFGTSTGLVGDHVEGTEPTPGGFTATSQTITPTAISGKVEINREVWDQGGSPQADQIIWGEMLRGYFEAIEKKIAAMLNGLAAATLYTGAEINLAGAVDAALQDALIDLFVDLQFVRGGNRYSAFVLDGQLFPAIAKAKDLDGRLLFPILGAQNAAGETEGNFSEVRIGSQRGRAAWALADGIIANAQHSYLFVPASVWQWVSPPRRFTFEYQVKSVDMAIWGYQAGAVLRNTDVARIDYTTADV